MKNILILLTVLALLCSLTGCQKPAPDVDTLTTLPENTEQTLPQIGQQIHIPLYSASLPTVSETVQADDGTELFRYTYQNISMIIPNPEVADRIIIDLLNRIDSTAQTAEQMKEAAQNAYQVNEAWTAYLCSILYTPSRLDSAIFSLYSAYSTYSGSSHPETAYASVTYDMLTGNALSLQDILQTNTTADFLTTLIIDQLNAAKDSQLYTGYEKTVASRFEDLTDTDWYLSGDGLCFYFSPYEIAPYAAGKIVAEIPYDQLPGILKDEYFPAELQAPTGTISQRDFDTDAVADYSQITEIVLQADGQKQLLHTDGIVYDLTIETGATEYDQFTSKATVYMAQSLSASDAIMIAYNLSEEENLRISYTGKDGDAVIYLP